VTGDATIIRLQRERAEVEQQIRYGNLTSAIDRYNILSQLLARLGRVTIPEE
jgi:hypothetical protein